MSIVPDLLFYTKEHEWLRLESQKGIIGITDHAQDSLGDVVYVEFPDIGSSFTAGESFGVVESVKAASELYMPVAGKVIEVNKALEETPELLNEDPYGEAWIIAIELKSSEELKALLSAEAYRTIL